MKYPSIILSLIVLVVITLSSCDKEPETVYKYDPKVITYDNLQKMSAFIKKNETKFQNFTIDGASGGVITSSNGVKYYIQPYAFTDLSGTPATGPVAISIKEIFKASEMILSDKPTLTTTGGILESYGEFFVKAQQNNKKLIFRVDSGQINNAIQIAMRNPNKMQQNIPLWEGDTIIAYTQSGHNFENTFVTKTTTIPLMKGMDWKALSGKSATANPDTIRFALPELFKWANCDILGGAPSGNTTVLCYFENHFNLESGSGYQGIQGSMCFFKPESKSTAVKLYNTIFDAPAGKEGFLSYQNSMPIGLKGTFIVISVVDEKFYCQTKAVTIDAPAAGKNYVAFSFQLKEVTEAELLALINGLN
jgi:hypothetical protein